MTRRVGRSLARLAAVVAAAVVVCVAALGAQAPQVPQGFTVGGNVVHENLPATPFVFVAYGIVWVALVIYVFVLWRKLGRVEQELARVNARLASRR